MTPAQEKKIHDKLDTIMGVLDKLLVRKSHVIGSTKKGKRTFKKK